MRSAPADGILDEVSGQSLAGVPTVSDAETLRAANRIVEGWYEPAALPPVRVGPGFRPEALDVPSATASLFVAGFVPVGILLRAYRLTGERRYFDAARAYVVEFAGVERGSWLPRGLLWNDHAIASRINVLTGFWRVLRALPAQDRVAEDATVALVARGAAQLAKPALFIAATNHGVMQNLALLQAAIAFPRLPGSDDWKRVAMHRLRTQFGYYASPEGVILEHSAGYHQFGVTLIAIALRLAQLAGEPAPPALGARYVASVDVLASWRRPDGTLPSFGDTATRAEPARGLAAQGATAPLVTLPVQRPEAPAQLLPVSGYATFWTGLEGWPQSDRLAQTSVVWSYFRGHGHKHADEMSLVIWAGGREWLSSVGYWPYDDAANKRAVSWGGSNAPHVVGERVDAARDTRALSWAAGEDKFFLDLERRGPDGAVVRREIVGVAGGRWIVLDISRTPGDRATRRIWNAGPGLRWRSEGATYAAGDDTRLALAIASDPPAAATIYSASRDPFAGWLVVDGRVVPGSAIAVEQSGNGWIVTSLALGARGAASHGVPRAQISSPERWSVALGDVDVVREGERLTIGRGTPVVLTPVPDPSTERERLAVAYERAVAAYPTSRDLLYYRKRATLVLVGAAVVQEGGFAWIRRKSRRLAGVLRLVSITAWLALGAWLGLVYLV
ncbi:MAG: heparinase II/III family protein [Burkholderiales bacterium]|nr:heparinase II/III family protein [Burkholderiales bacterium]